MLEYPFAYEKIAPTTWTYVSSLLMLALFFKFNRFWSIRNLDLVLIILLSPGIVLIDYGRQLEQYANEASQVEFQSNLETTTDPALNEFNADNATAQGTGAISESEQINNLLTRGHRNQRIGYYWLLSMCMVLLIRALIDPWLSRRPLLAPNLSVGGLVFLLISLMAFLFANILTSQPTADDIAAIRSTIKMVQREIAEEDETRELRKRGPGLPLFQLFPIIPTFSNSQELMQTDTDQNLDVARFAIGSKSLAIFSQTAIVLGLIFIGIWHFKDSVTGFAMACIYLMLPYTAQYMGNVIHVLPGALLVWAIASFRRPGIAGVCVGLATGVVYYPLFLLPLWISFYWERGAKRFIGGVLISIAVCVTTLAFTSLDYEHFHQQVQATFGFWFPLMDGLEGIWGLGWDSSYRLPILVAFFALCISFVFWPSEKNLGTLFAYTCVVMLGVQFWHGFEGGLIMAWFLPMALMTFFRPNTTGRHAKNELREKRSAKPESAEDLIGT